jgi:hypothetical protein
MVDLDAYAADCRVCGYVELGEGRLSDQLNSTLELHIRDARLEGLADGHVVEMPELTVAHDELCAVVASGPPGDAARWVHTRTTRVEVEVGPYRVEGRVHGTATSDPLGWSLRRPAWVPLTEANVVYRRGLDSVSDDVGTLLVNRNLASSFRAAEEARGVLPWEATRMPRPVAPRAVDLTGTLDEERSVGRRGARMADPSPTVRSIAAEESIATFEWRNLHLHVVTRDPLTADEVRTIERVLPKVASVGQFADVVAMVLGRYVRIRTERPSPNIRLEVRP